MLRPRGHRYGELCAGPQLTPSKGDLHSDMVKKTPIQGTDRVSVTFEIAPDRAASSVHVAGDFNQWDPAAHALKQRRDGTWAITLRLPRARAYEYRFVVDGAAWLTDAQADALAPNGFGEANAVVVLN